MSMTLSARTRRASTSIPVRTSIPLPSAARLVRPVKLGVSAKGMLTMILVAGLAFFALVGLIYMKYLIIGTQLEINEINQAIHTVGNEQTRLEERLERSNNIQSIMERAGALGMAQPSESQILYVQFPQEFSGESMALSGGK